MVLFAQKPSNHNAFAVDLWSKTTLVSSIGVIQFDKTQAFYLRGYSMHSM